jgi:hypothetical protein
MSFYDTLCEIRDLADNIEHWVSISATDSALRVAREIVRFTRGYRPKISKMPKTSQKVLRAITQEPTPRIPDWEFKQILDGAIRKLGSAEPYETLRLLTDSIGTYLNSVIAAPTTTPIFGARMWHLVLDITKQ